MSKYSEIVALLEYVDKKNKVPKTRLRDRYKSDIDLDLVGLLRKKHEEAKLLENFLKDQEKLNKKEEKKEQKVRAFTFAEGMILAFMAQFVLGPLYQHYVAALGVH